MDYKFWYNKYFEFGLKPTCISYLKTKYNINEQNPEKSPCHSWRRWQVRNPLKEEIIALPWENAMGIGTVLGFNNRCIDIDNCTDKNILKDTLDILGLPSDYEWAVKSPNGYHIHIESDSLPFITYKELNDGVLALKPNDEYINRLSRIELRWANHSVLPPTIINGRSYHFINNDFPTKAPSAISTYNIFRFITKFCGSYETDRKGEIGKYQLNKLFFVIINTSDYHDHELSIYDTSAENNKILLFENGYAGYNYRDESQSNAPLFIDIETTGLINDYLDYATYPRIIQISYSFGLNSEIFSYYIKPDNFTISKEIENLTSITKELLMKEGVALEKVIYSLPWKRESKSIVCYNADFDIPVLDVEHSRLKDKASKNPSNGRIGFYPNPFRGSTQIYCLMKKYSYFFGGKNPKLHEMYEELFKETAPKGIHNSFVDVEILKDCFYLMILHAYIKFSPLDGMIEDA